MGCRGVYLGSLGSDVILDVKPQLQRHLAYICMSICQTGVVQVNRPLDRERVAEYRLTITVKDNPENARIARRVLSPLTSPPPPRVQSHIHTFHQQQFYSSTTEPFQITASATKPWVSLSPLLKTMKVSKVMDTIGVSCRAPILTIIQQCHLFIMHISLQLIVCPSMVEQRQSSFCVESL